MPTKSNATCQSRYCGKPLSEHIEGKPCVDGKVSTAKSIWDLPIARRMWEEDARDLNA